MAWQDADDRLRSLMEHGDLVRRLAPRLVRDPDVADDLVQETWLAAIERPPERSEAGVAWLRAVMRNIAVRLHRGDGRRHARERAAATGEATESTFDVVERLALQHEVVQAVLALDEPYRTTLLLRYLDDLSPDDIARRMDVPRNTVRARLYRARRRIREQLDERCGRDAWCAALLSFPGVAASSASAAGLGFPGWWIMKLKFPLVAAAGGLLLALAASMSLVGPWGAGMPHHPGRGPEAESIAAVAPPDVGLPAVPDDAEVAADERGAEVGLAPRPDRELASREPAAVPDPGRVRMRVTHPGDVVPPPDVTVRFSSERRFAESERIDREFEAHLTADTYDGALIARGYEPSTIAPFVVADGEVTDLGEVALHPGRAAIQGVVSAFGFPADRALTIRLLGRDRRPCPECVTLPAASDEEQTEGGSDEDPYSAAWSRSAPCDRCGYASDHSQLAVHPGGTFHFANLASGPYLVRAFDEELRPVGVAVPVELGPGEWRTVHVRLQATFDLDVGLVTADGLPFTGEWSVPTEDADGATEDLVGAAIRFELRWSGEEEEFARARIGRRFNQQHRVLQLVRSSLQLNRQARFVHLADIARHVDVSFTVDPDLLRLPERVPTLDRARTDEDALHVPAVPPAAPVVDLPAAVIDRDAGRFTVRAVPAGLVEVRVSCGPYLSDPTLVDLRAGAPPELRCVMHLRPETPRADGANTVTSRFYSLNGDDASTSLRAGVFALSHGELSLPTGVVLGATAVEDAAEASFDVVIYDHDSTAETDPSEDVPDVDG